MPKTAFFFLFAAFFVTISSCSHYQMVKYDTYQIPSVDNNVCKKLSGQVIFFAIFVDSKYTQPWSEYDIASTLDSINKAKDWLERLAVQNGIPLSIDIKIHRAGKTIPIINNLPDKTLSQTLFSPNPFFGIPKFDRWSDRIARTAGLSLPKDTSKIVRTPNRLTDRERLIARLRDIYQTDNIALMYFVNNYYNEDISLAIHTANNSSPEYAIVGFKRPAVIAHEFLHLFGALDLYISPFDKKKKNLKRKAEVMKLFPDEIMAFAAYRQLSYLNISPFTKYLIGWETELDDNTRQKVLGKKIKVVKY